MAKKAREVMLTSPDVDQAMFTSKVKNTDELSLFKCTTCGNVHFRHAGYVEAMTPYMELKPGKEPEVKSSTTSLQVKICTSCKSCYVDHTGKMYDITKHIDLDAWDSTEKELHKTIGPGGNC